MSGDVIGSWFPSGFHGHFRTKFRNDFIQQYRIAARPPPPAKLLRRLQENPRNHFFSKLDNRGLILSCDGCHEDNVPKEGSHTQYVCTPKGNDATFKRELLSWIPLKEELATSGPPLSVYHTTYCREKTSNTGTLPRVQLPRLLLHQAASEPYNTTYRHAYCDGPIPDPVRNTLTAKSCGESSLKIAATSKQALPRVRQDLPSFAPLTVSDCLKWSHLPECG